MYHIDAGLYIPSSRIAAIATSMNSGRRNVWDKILTQIKAQPSTLAFRPSTPTFHQWAETGILDWLLSSHQITTVW